VIATAYGDYSKKSFEDTRLFVEKLSGVKSIEKSIEVQTEYAKTAYETFVTQSQKIGAPIRRHATWRLCCEDGLDKSLNWASRGVRAKMPRSSRGFFL
jgi:hypothetical protein